MFTLHNMLNLDCAHFFLSVWWKKNQITIYNFINLPAATFHVRLSMGSFFCQACKWHWSGSAWLPREIGNLVTWFADTINTDSKLMFNLTVLCFCQFCACFLSHMPLEFAKHVNLRNSKKPKRSLKPIHQSSCYMMTGELFSLKYWRKIITEWQGIKWISV